MSALHPGEGGSVSDSREEIREAALDRSADPLD